MHTPPSCKLPATIRAAGALGLGVVAAFIGIGFIGANDTNAGPSAIELAAAALWSTNPASTFETAPREVPELGQSSPAPLRKAVSAERGTYAPATRTNARVDLRCWQDGVLIVNESRIAPAAEPFSYLIKFPSKTGGGLPLYLVAYSSATCLIKPVAE